MFSFLKFSDNICTCHACMHKQNTICTINCKTKISLASFFPEEFNCMVTHASNSDRLENFILKPVTKHCINFPAS